MAVTTIKKQQLEKAHFNSLTYSRSDGAVYTNSQVNANWDEADPNAVGITATLGTGANMTIARDGVYNIVITGLCIDVNSTGFIAWLYVNYPSVGTVAFRNIDQTITVGQGRTWSWQMWLPAGTILYANMYSGSGATRFGTDKTNATWPHSIKVMCHGMSVAEIR